ncbi:DNA (cytosine-5)-methyltransferase 3A-like [Montipora capricornis]|uniref:DNA (cytosine-5)-methyltransferase 3A-like n=2 Tax=Montipora TaxID=46703 RepID=UPI0035F14D90
MASTPTSIEERPKKKPKFKRRLEFSASDYKSKKKIRVKSDLIISLSAVEDKGVTTSEDNVSTSDEENVAVDFVYGQLVWGRLKGYDWWPGLIISHVEAQKAPPTPSNHWIRWFGDNKFSLLSVQCLRPFSKFKESFIPGKMRGIYKRAVIDSLEVAVRRCRKVFTKTSNKQTTQIKKKTATRKAKIEAKQTEEQNEEPLGERDRQEMMVQWAVSGFKPSGPKGFAPTDEDVSSDTRVAARTAVMNATSLEDSDHKSRFGKPVMAPNLAENIKALFDDVVAGKKELEGICLACGDLRVSAKHPLFKGGLCKECKTCFLENIYLYDEDGSQMYCTICGDGKEVFMCDNTGCFRSYCSLCIGMLCGVNTVTKIAACEKWVCYMCSGKTQGLITPRKDWSARLQELFMNDKEQDFKAPHTFPAILPEERRPMRVLSLFDGIASGLQAVKELGIEIELYCASEIDEQAVQVAKVQHGSKIHHIGDIQKISRAQIQELGPFDFVFGGSPCNDLSIANPIRKGIYEGTGRLFFDFYRLLECVRPKSELDRPFFWLFENVVGMRAEDKCVISRFLECNPVVVDAKEISPAHRARYFWGNLPGMNRPTIPLPGDKLCLQDCLEPNCGRLAKFTKVQTLTTNANSMLQTKKALLPVQYVASDGQEKEDILWITEMERLFGLPSHYTDVSNMGRSQRQRLLGKSWSVPVIRHLLSPLKDYYKCET